MGLRECMEKHTERELRVWLEWLNLQMDEPDRGDWYSMQIACEVRRVITLLCQSRRDPTPVDFKLKFQKGPQIKAESIEQAAQWAKAKWFGAVGIPPPKDQ